MGDGPQEALDIWRKAAICRDPVSRKVLTQKTCQGSKKIICGKCWFGTKKGKKGAQRFVISATMILVKTMRRRGRGGLPLGKGDGRVWRGWRVVGITPGARGKREHDERPI